MIVRLHHVPDAMRDNFKLATTDTDSSIMFHRMRKDYLLLKFPTDKKNIGKLPVEKKAEWYQFQFNRDAGAYPVELTTKDFARFWKWRYYLPLRMKRFFFRVKNFEIFKKYEHISVMKEKTKKHGV